MISWQRTAVKVCVFGEPFQQNPLVLYKSSKTQVIFKNLLSFVSRIFVVCQEVIECIRSFVVFIFLQGQLKGCCL